MSLTNNFFAMEYRKLSDLVKLKNNPRIIIADDMDRLKESIKKFGVLEARPLILSNRTGELVIIGGNMRYEACKDLKIKEVPTQLMEGLSEADEREIIIRDNISNGDWDMSALANEWSDDALSDWGLDTPSFDDLDFDDIEGNQDRAKDGKTKQVTCPECDHTFNV